MGKRGPVPKRSDQRRRRNKQSPPEKAPSGTPAAVVERRPAKNASREVWNAYAAALGIAAGDFASKDALIAAIDGDGDEGRAPAPNLEWHPVVKEWFRALAKSGQSTFYEPSDWATATVIGESMSRELQPQFVGMRVTVKKIDDEIYEESQPVYVDRPLKGASLAAYLKAMNTLLVMEGDRRRAQLELKRPAKPDDPHPDVPRLDDFRDRLSG